MRILFAHRSVVGHFIHLAPALVAAGHEVVFLAAETEGAPAGLRTVGLQPSRQPHASTHHYLQPLERAVLLGQAAFRAARSLAEAGFDADAVVFHAGFGPGLYLKDAFPRAGAIGWFEWFYEAHGTDADFLDPAAIGPDDELRIRTLNAGTMVELAACDRAVAPTEWQRGRFPQPFRTKLQTLHEGIDTGFFAPGLPETAAFGLPEDAEVVTYVARGLEPYRGFPDFVRAVAILQRRRPRLVVVLAGSERTWYGPKPPPAAGSWRQLVLDREGPELDLDRLVILPFLPQARVRDLFRRSDVHVYLTVPFVLSWSVLEAMATGCALVAADTPPVREVVEDGRNGVLADMRDPAAIAAAVERLLDDRAEARRLRTAARATILERFALERQLIRQRQLLEQVVRSGR
ncbi:MAG: glycosyltransferase [Geminicoccaceae bacterium]